VPRCDGPPIWYSEFSPPVSLPAPSADANRWKADKIVAEKNFGGAMVESTIRTARRHAPIKLVNTSRGKVQRAEPVSLLYERGQVRHVGQFPELERQCCRFSPAGYVGAGSPDRADAAIWALTELMLDPEPQPNIRFFDIPNLPAY
jgi:phage terminase large subunit-like protein